MLTCIRLISLIPAQVIGCIGLLCFTFLILHSKTNLILLFCSIDTCKKLIGSSVNIIESVESKDLKRVLYELCWCGVNGHLKVDQVTSALADVAVS